MTGARKYSEMCQDDRESNCYGLPSSPRDCAGTGTDPQYVLGNARNVLPCTEDGRGAQADAAARSVMRSRNGDGLSRRRTGKALPSDEKRALLEARVAGEESLEGHIHVRGHGVLVIHWNGRYGGVARPQGLVKNQEPVISIPAVRVRFKCHSVFLKPARREVL